MIPFKTLSLLGFLLVVPSLVAGEGDHRGNATVQDGKGQAHHEAKASATACVDPEQDRHPDCANVAHEIELVVREVNRTHQISKLFEPLKKEGMLMEGAPIGALITGASSPQASRSAIDPRIFLRTRCGYMTFTLFGNSIEMSVPHQTAELPLPFHFYKVVPTDDGKYPKASTDQSKEEGELLVELKPIGAPPGKTPLPLSAPHAFHAWDPAWKPELDPKTMQPKTRPETHTCTSCHIDVTTQGPSGVKKVNFSTGEQIDALVVPYDRAPGKHADMGPFLCAPSDLQLIYDCNCTSQGKGCEHLEAFAKKNSGTTSFGSGDSRKEACARLEGVLSLNPKQHCGYSPKTWDIEDERDCASEARVPQSK